MPSEDGETQSPKQFSAVSRSADRVEIGDAGIPVLEYVALLKHAGFLLVDVLYRDAEKAVLAAVKY